MADKEIAVHADKADQLKRAKHRSPNFPMFGLEKAVERAKVLYDKEKRHWVPISVAHTHWEYKPLSGAGNQCVAALRSFGLVEVQGEGDKRQVRVSDIAHRIVLDAPDRKQLLKTAAITPGIHGEIWSKYGSDGLPTDSTLKHHLIWEKKFNEDSVDAFIAQFKGTISFAELTSSDKLAVQVADNQPQDEQPQSGVEMNFETASSSSPSSAAKNLLPAKGALQDMFSLDEGPVQLIYPANLSEHSLEDFKDWIELAVRKIERSIKRKADSSAKIEMDPR